MVTVEDKCIIFEKYILIFISYCNLIEIQTNRYDGFRLDFGRQLLKVDKNLGRIKNSFIE